MLELELAVMNQEYLQSMELLYLMTDTLENH